MKQEIKVCEECGSKYYAASSPMNSLCPECSHIIYGSEPCDHEFDGKRCRKCFWDGSTTEYITGLKKK